MGKEYQLTPTGFAKVRMAREASFKVSDICARSCKRPFAYLMDDRENCRSDDYQVCGTIVMVGGQ